MSDNKFVKAILDAATITGLAAGIGWTAKKLSETFTTDPSLNVMNFVKFTVVIICNGWKHCAKAIPRG